MRRKGNCLQLLSHGVRRLLHKSCVDRIGTRGPDVIAVWDLPGQLKLVIILGDAKDEGCHCHTSSAWAPRSPVLVIPVVARLDTTTSPAWRQLAILDCVRVHEVVAREAPA